MSIFETVLVIINFCLVVINATFLWHCYLFKRLSFVNHLNLLGIFSSLTVILLIVRQG